MQYFSKSFTVSHILSNIKLPAKIQVFTKGRVIANHTPLGTSKNPSKPPERQGRRNLLRRSRKRSNHTPLGVYDMHWIKVGRAQTHWIYTHCMCRLTSENPSKPPEWQGRRNLLHRSRKRSNHTPLGVCDMHWIKVGRGQTQWIYTHCMCR
jgi:hypothetical protein